MLISDLGELGLSLEEAKVYIAILELGGGYVSTIAKKSGVNRVACYHTLGKLLDRGIVNSLEKNNVKYFAVENVKVIVDKQKELLKKAERLLPELGALINKSAYRPKMQYYEGLNGIKIIFEDTLTTKKELLGYTNLAELPIVISEDYLKDYAKRKIDLGIKTRMLSPISKDGLKYLSKYYPKGFDHDLVEILFVNSKQFLFEYEINIYDNKVAIVSLNPDEIIGLIIESPVYANTQRAI
ncbi:MAG: helix-turn-helix domain-containing protein, partial [Candidatus Gracilibacteria bacterium]